MKNQRPSTQVGKSWALQDVMDGHRGLIGVALKCGWPVSRSVRVKVHNIFVKTASSLQASEEWIDWSGNSSVSNGTKFIGVKDIAPLGLPG